jgi:PAS domain S-box-containing protein
LSIAKLVGRQLSKFNLSKDHLPANIDEWKAFIATVEKTFEEFETQRQFNENLLDVSTKEMERLYKQIEEQASQKIKTQEEKLENVINSVPALVAWVDRTGHIVGLNDQFSEFFKIEKSALTGKKFENLNLPEVGAKIDKAFSELSPKTETDITMEHRGQTVNLKFAFKVFANNQMMALVGVDLTEDFQRQKQLEEAQTKSLSSARMAVLGEMASGIAHEINNPLAVVNTNAQKLIKMAQTQNYAELEDRANKILSIVKRISKIISGLRTFARDGEQDPFEPNSIKQIIDDSLELVTERIRMLNIELRVQSIDPNLKVDCRSAQIAQVVVNAISNSRDAIEKFDTKWISVEVVELDNRVKIMITDSGNGIPAEIRERIFQPFFTTKEVGVGTGLGLSISIGILRAHKGAFYIDTDCPNTRFVIDLPKKYLK